MDGKKVLFPLVTLISLSCQGLKTRESLNNSVTEVNDDEKCSPEDPDYQSLNPASMDQNQMYMMLKPGLKTRERLKDSVIEVNDNEKCSSEDPTYQSLNPASMDQNQMYMKLKVGKKKPGFRH